MKIDRIELADLATPEALAAGILKQVPDMQIPVPVEVIAGQLGISEIRRLPTEGFEGGLVAFADRSDGVILVNSRSSRQRQRFTIGHELAHFLNPWHKPRGADGFRCTARDLALTQAKPDDRAARMEVEANRFSADLLLPRPQFRKDLARLKVADVEHIVVLARRYDMSKESTARRYVEEHDERVAVIVSQQGVVRRVYRHKSFPYVECRPGEPIPADAATARAVVREGETSGWIEVDGGVWLDTKRGRRSPRLCEQILGQQNGYRLTLITFDDDGDADTEEELERAWARPTFHR